MENINIYIKKRLDKYDESKYKYKDLIETNIESKDFKVEDEPDFLGNMVSLNFKNKYTGRISILGMYDENTRVWIWAWANISFRSKDTIGSRNILTYGLELETGEELSTLENINKDTINITTDINTFIKSHFINSRIYLKNIFTLDIHLALALSICQGAKFIYPQVKFVINNKKIITYYLVY